MNKNPKVRLISDILFEFDPMELNYGDNVDEYDSEAEAIVLRLSECHNVDDVCEVIYSVFNYFFDSIEEEVGGKDSFLPISKHIWAVEQRQRHSNAKI